MSDPGAETVAAGSGVGDPGEPLGLITRAPGRVNLIGDHTDYNEGLAFPMAIDLFTEVSFAPNASLDVMLYSTLDTKPANIPVTVAFDPEIIKLMEPPWARLAAAVVAQCGLGGGGVGKVTSGVPVGAGLSSSAALCVALAMALGVEGEPQVVARLCQRAEEAVGVEVGLMDPLTSLLGVAGHGLLMDFSDLSCKPVAIPDQAEIVVVHSGERRMLSSTPYRARRAECDAASFELGYPIGKAEEADLAGLLDPILRARTRHVVTECIRVRAFSDALSNDDLVAAGDLMLESHRSIAADFAASTDAIDLIVDDLVATDGVYGARMTGGGFGGCVVALCEPGAIDLSSWKHGAWKVVPSKGATSTVATR